MSNTLEFRETSQGSITAWGTGLNYNYDSELNSLDVTHRGDDTALARFNFDRDLSKDPLSYIQSLEKANQIRALMFSNNQTLDLTQTLDGERLSAILKSTATLSRHAHDLQALRFDRFCDALVGEFNLKKIKIKQFISGDETNAFFIARIQTQHDNGICVRACTLTGMTMAMSDRTIRDLITMEFGHQFEGSANNLLRLSSKLSSISHILDSNFVPAERISSESLKNTCGLSHWNQ